MNKQHQLLYWLLFLCTPSFAQTSSFGGEVVSWRTFREGLMVTRAKVPALPGAVSNMFFFNRADEPWNGNVWYEYDWEIRGVFPNNGWSQIRVRPDTNSDFKDAPENISTTIDITNSLLHWILIRKDHQYVYDIRRDFDVNTYDYNNAGAHGGNSPSLVVGGPRVYATGVDVADIPTSKQLDFSLGITAFDIEWTGPLPMGSYSADFVVDFTRFYGFSGNNLNSSPQWQDEFDFLDYSKWQIANWEFYDTRFTQNNIRIEDGKMLLTVSRDDGAVDSGSENLALSGTAIQSSTASSGDASKAIDDNTSGVYTQGSVTHTEEATNSWWQVDLRQDANLNRIEIFNRTDNCCVDRLANFSVSVLDSIDQLVWHRFYPSAPNPSLSINLDTRGRKVKINLDGILSMAEVKVFGTGIPGTGGGTDNDGGTDNGGDESTSISCNGTTITYGNGSITMIGGSFFQILNANWQEVYNCGWQCGNSKTADNLPNGDYRVYIKDNSYQIICEQVITLGGNSDNGGGNSDNGGGNSDNGGGNSDNGGGNSDNGGGNSDNGGGGTDTLACTNGTSIFYGNGTITMNGGSYFQVLDANWQEVFNCGWQCGSSQTANNLIAGDYRVYIKDNNYQIICEQVITLTTGNSSGGGSNDNGGSNSDNGGGNSDNGGSGNSNNGGGNSDNNGGGDNGTSKTCGDITINYGGGTVTMIGTANTNYYFKINDLDNGWADAGNCGWNCGNEFTVNNLPNNRFLLTIYNENWSVHCDTEITMTGSNTAASAQNRHAPHLSMAAHTAKRRIKLEWLSNSGFKVDNFTLEHSADGLVFTPIAQFINKKWSSEITYHQATDETPLAGANYYRIKESYLDGSSAYTKTKRVDFAIDLNDVSIFPNPVEETLFVNLSPYVGQQVQLSLVNQLGAELLQKEVNYISTNLLTMDASQLQNGLHYLVIR
ncbi:MAG: discoidin domain-containing protein, partial [Bacteroidota bacterium]